MCLRKMSTGLLDHTSSVSGFCVAYVRLAKMSLKRLRYAIFAKKIEEIRQVSIPERSSRILKLLHHCLHCSCKPFLSLLDFRVFHIFQQEKQSSPENGYSLLPPSNNVQILIPILVICDYITDVNRT